MAIISWLNKKDRGSLIPLSLGFFIIAMTLTFISINISAAYAVKKQLINVAEAAINKSAHSISLPAYYAQLNRFSDRKRVPLDCSAALSTFSRLIGQSLVSGKNIRIEDFDCDLYAISAEVSILAKFPIQIPFFSLDQFDAFDIHAKIGASSDYIPN